jgi:flagellum-specific ATP synthase
MGEQSAGNLLGKYRQAVSSTDPIAYAGTVNKSIGLLIESRGPHAGVGELCRIQVPVSGQDGEADSSAGAPEYTENPEYTEKLGHAVNRGYGSGYDDQDAGSPGFIVRDEDRAVYSAKGSGTGSNGSTRSVFAEVVGFRNGTALLFPYEHDSTIKSGARVTATGRPLTVRVGPELLGRVIDPLGNPLDGRGHLCCRTEYSIFSNPPHVLKRQRITRPLGTGIRAIDGPLTIGKGQRIGVFSGSGVGKSTILGMVARHTEADVNVIALIGERGREVREFIERDLGEEGLQRSVVVVATSNQAPIMRIRGAYLATAIAEYFRDLNNDVLFMMDSITRFAYAQREIGLAVGEPPATRGYTPSVFSMLPKLLERSGMSESGSITGIYSVLVEADEMGEPISDAVRGILDGHIVLSRRLAQKNQYPAVDVLASISRLTPYIIDEYHRQAIALLKRVLSSYTEVEDLVQIGAYVRGSDQNVDWALERIGSVTEYLKQGIFEGCSFQECRELLLALFENDMEQPQPQPAADSEAHYEVQAENRAEVQAETRDGSQADTEAGVQPAVQTEARAEAQADTE